MKTAPSKFLLRPLGEKKATNLNLTESTVEEAREHARKRYGASLSEMTDRLLSLELGHKAGLLNRKA